MIKHILLILLLATSASAQDLPALFNVTGVSANDSLNVRSRPNTTGTVLSKLPANATNIEVIQTTQDGKWGQINAGETTGWTSMRYLTASTPSPNFPPNQATCFGTEPFWTLTLQNGQASFSNMGEDEKTYTIHGSQLSANRTDTAKLDLNSRDRSSTALITRQLCNDGMSDRTFGLRIDVLSSDQVYSGCCSLAP
jgi:uncharacterized membrane protein